jgi:phosphate transport system substrate-binding protein
MWLGGLGCAFFKRLICVTVLVLAAGVCALTPAASAAQSLSGAGSALVAPLEAEWAQAFQAFNGVTVNYTADGSQAGISDISNRTVDFGASDAPLSAQQEASCHSCFQIPWALSAIGVGFHIRGIGARLLLTGKVLSEIFLGQITHWNDSQIKRLNPRLNLPNLKITPIHSAGSGDTYVFTNYLSDVSSTWRSRVGSGMTVSFPTGDQGNGIAGVTSLLQSVDGGIAYVGASYLIAHRLPAAAIKNADGHYEYPNLTQIEAAAKIVKTVPSNNALSIVDPPKSARSAYPISTFTYVIVPANAPQRSLLQSWIDYALGAGQQFDQALDFAALPSVVSRAAKATAKSF